jgi:hypothetical protein
MFDRWRPQDAIDGRYVWLPVEFRDDRLLIRWRDEWDLPVLGRADAQSVTGRAQGVVSAT